MTEIKIIPILQKFPYVQIRFQPVIAFSKMLKDV